MKISNNCYGCTACFYSCKFSGIDIKKDNYGFRCTDINNNCIKCNKCQSVCNSKLDLNIPIEVYALKNKNKDIRNTSSSGGYIYELSKYVISNGGVVFGACFTGDFKVRHMCIDKVEYIYMMQGSKYTESDLDRTFEMVKDNLEKGIYVLYTGTPCQINGLKKYLKNVNTEQLLTCDNVCHGVVSPLIFEEYKKKLEKEYDSKLKTFTFRYKDGKRTQNVKASFENNKEYIGLCKNDIFYKIFFKNIGYRESCYNCEFSKIKRVSDITVGDFWGIERSISNFDDKYGVSLLLNNTNKAMEIFDKIKDKFDVVKSNIDDCLQPNLISPTPKGYKNEIFWEEFRKNGLEKGGELLDE